FQLNLLNVVFSRFAERAGSEKYALPCLVCPHAASECCNLWAADHLVRPSFRLDANQVKAKRVFLDDAIDPAVAGASDMPGRVRPRAAVAHRQKQIENQPLEEGG